LHNLNTLITTTPIPATSCDIGNEKSLPLIITNELKMALNSAAKICIINLLEKIFCPVCGNSVLLGNVGAHVPDYTMSFQMTTIGIFTAMNLSLILQECSKLVNDRCRESCHFTNDIGVNGKEISLKKRSKNEKEKGNN
jgi:hypothetical protein